MMHKSITILSLALFGTALGFSQSPGVTLNTFPTRALGIPVGQPANPNPVPNTNPNLVEGREFATPQGIALDASGATPILYVSDTGNNRVLAWKNAAGLSNGQPADLVIGQPDKYTTTPGGPSSAYATGLFAPSGIAVYKGDLYVADTGNNRVVRYPKPFLQTTQYPIGDLWLGQSSPGGRSPNSTGAVSARGVYFSSSSTAALVSSIAFDSSGNLWLTDPGNRRVLEFKASDLACSGCGGQSAVVVLGQSDFTHVQSPALTLAQSNSVANNTLNQFDTPSNLAFDSAGNLFVTDSDPTRGAGRVLVFTPSRQTTGQSANRIMGVFAASYTFPTDPTQAQALVDKTVMLDPEGILFFGSNQMGVMDASGGNRMLVFDGYSAWPADGSPPQAKAILGQPNTCTQNPSGACRYPNNGNPQPSAGTFATAGAVAYAGNLLYVADTSNNRVLVIPPNASGGFDASSSATVVLGQDRFNTNSVNLIEGREFYFHTPGGVIQDAAIAIDTTGSVPHLYISDPGNNRVLGFKDMRKITAGTVADIVIGQPDFQTALCNYPANDQSKPTQSSLCRPVGLAVDAKGNLYVADSLNGRVLRFPAPFGPGQPTAQEPADLVLGQTSFTFSIAAPGNNYMGVPYGVAISGISSTSPGTGLVVSDQAYNRVLYFPFDANYKNGASATVVLGQQNFTATLAGTDDASLSGPHHIASDTSGQVYVADTGNNRVLIFTDPNSPAITPRTGAHGLPLAGLANPQGVFVSPQTGEIWVANSNGSQVVRWANYQQVQTGSQPTAIIPVYLPLALAADPLGNLIAADSGNRILFFYQSMQAVNGANFLTSRALAPGMAATLCPTGSNACLNPKVQFTSKPVDTCSNYSVTPVASPLPNTLGDYQVLVNGVVAPLYFASPCQINFYVPQGTPTSGTADVLVVQVSTGQVLADSQVPMNSVSPGLFMWQEAVTGPAQYQQVAVLNQDNTVNSVSNQAPRGSVVQLFGTGQGLVNNPPPDGVAATDASATSIATPTISMPCSPIGNIDDPGCETPVKKHLLFSGLAPGNVGLWQINILVPQLVSPGQVPLYVVLNGVTSVDTSYHTVIYVK